MFMRIALSLAGITMASSVPVHAAGQGKVSPGDTAWVLICTAMVMLMTPALGLFYGGMVRQKNVLATIMQSFAMAGIVGVQWVLYGYSLAFGHDHWHLIGGLEWVGLKGVGLSPNAAFAPTVPHQAFMAFQLMFAVITPALITGAFAERMKFKSFLIFGVLWVTLIYDPVAHWVWAPGGWLRNMGALDFAGGTVVHICSGISALACALVVGRRRGYGREDMSPHNMTMTVVGASLLWFGWFGFNAGSALAANGIAVNALVVTNTSAAAAALSWMLVEWLHKGKPSLFGVATGAVAGLVAITPASGYVGPMAAVVIGLLVSLFSYAAIELKGILGYDDSLDVFGVHGVGGMWGAIATGLFASLAVNPAGGNGLLHGNARLFLIQLIAVLAVGIFSFAGTIILLKVTHAFSDLRVSEEEEHAGLDLSQHGEIGYLL